MIVSLVTELFLCWVVLPGPRRVRMVTHYEVSDADVKRAITALTKIMAVYAPSPSEPEATDGAASSAVIPKVDISSVQLVPTSGSGQALVVRQEASTALTQMIPKLVDTTATTIINGTLVHPSSLEKIEEVQEEERTEEVNIVGVSTSDQGFVVVLMSPESQRALRVVVTPTDPMSAGLDVHQVRG